MSGSRIEAPPVTYERSDYDALVRRNRHPAYGPIMLAATWLTLFLVVSLTLIFLLSGRIYWRETGVLVIAIIVLAMLLWGFPSLSAQIMMAAAKRSGVLVEQNFSIDDEGFRAESTRGVTLNRWAALHKIEEVDERLFVYTSPQIAYIVPRRVFASDSDFAAFVAAVRDRRSRAIEGA